MLVDSSVELELQVLEVVGVHVEEEEDQVEEEELDHVEELDQVELVVGAIQIDVEMIGVHTEEVVVGATQVEVGVHLLLELVEVVSPPPLPEPKSHDP